MEFAMASPNMQIDQNGRARVAERVTNKVADALKSDRGSVGISTLIHAKGI
jgi:GTP cyclohydrolase I